MDASFCTNHASAFTAGKTSASIEGRIFPAPKACHRRTVRERVCAKMARLPAWR